MLRTLILIGGAFAAMAWLVHQPAYQHDAPHKQVGALIAISVPFFLLDVILSVRKKRRARARSSSSPVTARSSRTRIRAGERW